MGSGLRSDAEGFEPPAAVFFVKPPELDRGLDGEIFVEFVLENLLAAVFVTDADVGIPHLAKVLLAIVGIVNGHHDDDLVNSGI